MCAAEKYKGKYPRIAYCPETTPMSFKGREVWIEGDDLIVVPTFDMMDLFIYAPYKENSNNFVDPAETKSSKVYLYRRVLLEDWLVVFDSDKPPTILNYFMVWPPSRYAKGGGPIKSLADYEARLPPMRPIKIANERVGKSAFRSR